MLGCVSLFERVLGLFSPILIFMEFPLRRGCGAGLMDWHCQSILDMHGQSVKLPGSLRTGRSPGTVGATGVRTRAFD